MRKQITMYRVKFVLITSRNRFEFNNFPTLANRKIFIFLAVGDTEQNVQGAISLCRSTLLSENEHKTTFAEIICTHDFDNR